MNATGDFSERTQCKSAYVEQQQLQRGNFTNKKRIERGSVPNQIAVCYTRKGSEIQGFAVETREVIQKKSAETNGRLLSNNLKLTVSGCR